jgi:hypothetical protein
VLHDQYIVRLCPEHFTVYHPAVPGVTSPALQAAVLAFFASIAPGMALGFSTAVICRAGNYPKLGLRYALIGTVIVILFTELVSVGTGLFTYMIGPLYPEACYPDNSSVNLQVTQTIQITCYLFAALLSAIFLFWTLLVRIKKNRSLVKRSVEY